MRALDTNVLVRFLVADDPQQHPVADRLIRQAAARSEKLYLSLIVICETAWVLERRYKHAREVIADALEAVLDTEVFLVEHNALLRRCLQEFRAGKAGLADYVIGAFAEEAGCTTTVTFDRDLQGVAGFKVLE